MKIGVVFSGQGAQYCGMGKDLYEKYSASRDVFNAAGEQIKDWCFNGDENTLSQTHVTQPTIYTMTMAAYSAFIDELKTHGLDKNIEISALAGFSLGEYSALTAAGVIENLSIGTEIVSKRGVLMQQAGLDDDGNAKGGMAAAIGDRKTILDIVEEVKEDGILEGVNFNSPIQTVVAGDKAALKRFRKKAKEYKIKAIPLLVSTAFHSSMMAPAAEQLKSILMQIDFKLPKVTVYSNVTADDIMMQYDGEDLTPYFADMMSKQAKSPVYWEETIKKIYEDGINVIVEIGPGKTLTGFINKINPDIVTLNVENAESLEDALKQLEALL